MKRIILAAAVSLAFTANAAYKCVDPKGVTLIGDTPPDGCATVVMYEVSPSGMILRRIEPTPTPEQMKSVAENAEKNRAAEKAAAEQRRKDLALLATYADAKEFDVARDRNIEPINGRIKATEDRMKQVDKRGKELADEMEFYKAGKSKKEKDKEKEGKATAKEVQPPTALIVEVERNKNEKALLERTLADYQKEIEATKAKYENDKQRWLSLRAGGWATTSSSASGSSTPATKPAGETKK